MRRHVGTMSEADGEKLERAINGDTAALGELLETHGPEVRGTVAASLSSVWRSSLDADDVMQVTYLEAFLRIRQFSPKGPNSFVAWLQRIAQNNLRDAVRELERVKRPDPRRRAEMPQGDESYFALLDVVGLTTSTPSRQAARGEAATAIEQAVRTLPDDYAQVIRQCDLNGFPVTEVAQTLGRSVGAVHMLRARAHERLREKLGTESRYFSRVS